MSSHFLCQANFDRYQNHAMRTQAPVAREVPFRLLSMAAEIYRAQRGTRRLAVVPDWNRVGNNDDICWDHPMYAKMVRTPCDVGLPVPAPVPEVSGTTPGPVAGPSSVRRPVPIPRVVITRAVPSAGVATGSGSDPSAGPSTSRKRRLSHSPPARVKKSRKVAPKSKEVLSDTDMEIDPDTQKEKMPTMEGAMTKGTGKAKVKGKAKAKDVEAKVTEKGKGKAPAPATDDEDFNLNITDVSDDPAVDVSFIPQFHSI